MLYNKKLLTRRNLHGTISMANKLNIYKRGRYFYLYLDTSIFCCLTHTHFTNLQNANSAIYEYVVSTFVYSLFADNRSLCFNALTLVGAFFVLWGGFG